MLNLISKIRRLIMTGEEIAFGVGVALGVVVVVGVGVYYYHKNNQTTEK